MNKITVRKILLAVSFIIFAGLISFSFIKVAEKNKIISMAIADCGQVQDTIDKNVCYWNYAVPNRILEVCDKIGASDITTAHDCYRAIAREKNDISICEKIADEPKKIKIVHPDPVIENLPLYTGPGFSDTYPEEPIPLADYPLPIVSDNTSSTYSVSFNTVTDREFCYFDLAQINKDKSICGKIAVHSSEDTFPLSLSENLPVAPDYRIFCEQCVTETASNPSLCYPVDRTPSNH